MLNSDFKIRMGKYAVLSAITVICSFAEINNLTPFGFASYYSAVFAGANAVALIPALIAGAVLANPSWFSALSALFAGALTSVIFYLLRKSGKEATFAIMALIVFIGQAGYVAVSWMGGARPIFLAIDLCLCYVFAYVNYCALKPIIKHKMKYSLLDTEIACLYITVIAISMGICSTFSDGKIALFALSALFIPLSCKLVGKGTSVMLAMAIGLGSAFVTLDVTDIAMLGFVALACCMFISAPRILAPIAQVFAVAVFELFFDVDYLSLGYHAIAMAVGGLLYALIPAKAISVVGERYFRSHATTAVRHVINRNRYDLSKSVLTVSAVFDEMSAILGGMEKSHAGNADAIADKVITSVCSSCNRFSECSSCGLSFAMRDLAEKTEQKGKTSISDIPPLLVEKCLYIGKIMSEMSAVALIKAEESAKNQEDNKVTALLATQMEGVSRILRAMSVNASKPISYDAETEKKIIEELKYYNVICSEALLCLGESVSATLIIRRDCAEESKLICDVVGKILRQELAVKSVDDGLISGWSIVELETRMQYDVIFGVASKPLRGEAIGDTHSFMKIGGNKFLMAVCDGMGAGKSAYELSDRAMTLVEDFYRAGFDHDVTVEGINRFLNYRNAESFSALDVAVCDLGEGRVDLVKLAAPSSYVKRSDSVIRVDSCSLPLGVVSDVSPAVSTFELGDGDVIVIVSDGVSQRFEGDKLSAIINNTSGVNPQKMADVILAEAERSRGAPEDDMTVAVCRVFKRA